MFPAARGAPTDRLSGVAAASGCNEKPVELIRLALAPEVPMVVPLGP